MEISEGMMILDRKIVIKGKKAGERTDGAIAEESGVLDRAQEDAVLLHSRDVKRRRLLNKINHQIKIKIKWEGEGKIVGLEGRNGRERGTSAPTATTRWS